MSKAEIRVEGFVTRDPELRQHQGKDVISVDVAHTPRKKDSNDQWVDAGETMWFQAAFWEKDAAPIAAAVRKGTLVTITGLPELNVFTKQDGSTSVNVRIKGATLGIIPRQAQQATYAPNTAPQPQWDTQATNGAQTGAQTGSWATAGQIDRASFGGGNDETPF